MCGTCEVQIKMVKNTGFSLIELMVVVAIIALIAAVAVPAYNSYTIKAKISSALSIMETFKHQVVKAYEVDGAFPQSVMFNGVNVQNNVAAVVDLGPVYSILYTIGGINNNAIVISYYHQGLGGISNLYTDPASGGGNYSGFHYGIAERNGVLKYACGAWDLSGFPQYDIPMEFMPSHCTCTNVGDFMGSGGAVTTGC